MFFSEEKNQKTFVCLGQARRRGSRLGGAVNNKSLLLLFFRKEESFFLPLAT
jgi:hypothetical protein